MITLIVARDRNGAIGREGDIPWRVKEDFTSFQRETLGGALIMGRNTWESLPAPPLPRRLNIVVSSSDVPYMIERHEVCRSVSDAIELAYNSGYRRVYGIGGEGIYREMLPLADRLVITNIDIEVAEADTFFPDFDENDWIKIGDHTLKVDNPMATLVEYKRK